MASENLQGFGKNDDPLNKALAELNRPGVFSKTFDSGTQRHDETLGAIVTAVRLLIGEVQGLRDEVESLRNGSD